MIARALDGEGADGTAPEGGARGEFLDRILRGNRGAEEEDESKFLADSM